MKLKELIPGRKRLRQYWRDRRAEKTFQREFEEYKSLVADDRHQVAWEDRYPCLTDRTNNTEFDRHYIFHTAWAARVLANLKPTKHVDIGSSLYFIANVPAFVPVAFYDYRPAELNLHNVTTHKGSLDALPFEDQSIESLSCMHVVEHVGLGRYGDPIDPQGDKRAMSELQRVVAVGGSLLFVTPVGKPKVCFNAHRVYGFDQVLDCFPELELEQFSLIPDSPDDGGLILEADPSLVATQSYGCGCFWLRRKR